VVHRPARNGSSGAAVGGAGLNICFSASREPAFYRLSRMILWAFAVFEIYKVDQQMHGGKS